MYYEEFPHLLRIHVMSTVQMALAHAGIDPMEVETIEVAEKGNYNGWKVAKATRIALL